MKHIIKIMEKYADAVYDGTKTFEVRYNDRNYQVGDVVQFLVVRTDGRTLVPEHSLNGEQYEITYLLEHFFVESDLLVVFSIKRMEAMA